MSAESANHSLVTPEHLGELQSLVAEYGVVPESTAFAICYGSLVRDASRYSDIDMLIVEDGQITDKQAYINSLIDLHESQDRYIDIEVPFDNKLFYTPEEVAESFSLSMFKKDGNGMDVRMLVGVSDGDEYFESEEMKLRLCLNAFTSGHAFIGGNRQRYEATVEQGRQALGSLARQLSGFGEMTTYTQARKAILAETGVNQKDYLGYMADDPLFDSLLASVCCRQSVMLDAGS